MSRRTPRQRRSAERVDRILDAAAALVAEGGTAAATTNAIAARARTSVGSLYQFFPNGDAVLRAVAQRHDAAFEEVKDLVFGPTADALPLGALMQRIVDALGAFFDAHPSYPRLYAALLERPRTQDAGRAHHAVIDQVQQLILRRYPRLDLAHARAISTVQVHAAHAVLIATAFETEQTRRDARAALVEMFMGTFREAEARRDATAETAVDTQGKNIQDVRLHDP